jgi:flagellar P-ring protein precursor FlgI
MPAAVTHGSMVVTITEDLLVSQPPPFADGPGAQTVVVPDSSITVEQPESRMFLLSRGVTLNDIVQAVNAVGAAPADLVAILEALKQAGALQAELIVI